jgi:hypothetical protein
MSQNIAVESNVEIPTIVRGKLSKYPFRTMEVNDSFFSETANARSAALQFARTEKDKGNAVKFVSRGVTENGVQGFRIWRTA